MDELKAAIININFEVWEHIEDGVTKKLVFSMPQRCASVTARPLCMALLSDPTSVE